MKYLTLIYDNFNVLIRIEERDSITKAERAGRFYTQRDGWFQIILPEDEDEREMWYAILNA